MFLFVRCILFTSLFVCTPLLDEECPEGKEFRECVCPDNLDGDATCYEDWYHGGKENCDLDPVEGCFCPPGTREDENGECVPCCKSHQLYCYKVRVSIK